MEDKMFEFMTKMYSEITTQLKVMDKKIEVMDKKLDNKADKQDIVRLEYKLDNNSKALFDGYKQTFEKLVAVENKVDDISSIVRKHEVEITVIKGGNKTKAK